LVTTPHEGGIVLGPISGNRGSEGKLGVKPSGRSMPLAQEFTDSPLPPKKKLSYLEAREYAGSEQRIVDAERVLESKRAELDNPAGRP